MLTVTIIKKRSSKKRKSLKKKKSFKKISPHKGEHCGECGSVSPIMYSSHIKNGKRIYICGDDCHNRLPEKFRYKIR